MSDEALENLLAKAKLAMRLGKSPEIVLSPTGQVRIVPKGKMPLYKMDLEPQPKWPALAEVYEDFVFGNDDFETDSLPAAPTNSAPQLPAAAAPATA